MKADLKGLFVLDAILGLLINILIHETFAGMKVGYTGGIQGLPRWIPNFMGDLEAQSALKSDNILALIVLALPVIFATGRIKSIFLWAFWTFVAQKAYDEVNMLLAPA